MDDEHSSIKDSQEPWNCRIPYGVSSQSAGTVLQYHGIFFIYLKGNLDLPEQFMDLMTVIKG